MEENSPSSVKQIVYPVREYPVGSPRVAFSPTNTGFNAPQEFSNGVYFIGIGGIGISAIARMMLLEGAEVSGSDTTFTLVTDELEKLGAKIFIGHNPGNIPEQTTLVIYTIAISDTNPELVEAKKRGLTTLSYPEALGKISREKFTIAVSGTHGKTTTTGMMAKIFMDAGKEPTVIVGSFLKGEKSNFIAGSGPFIVEACEYRRSFLNLSPRILVITNVDEDHLDYYKDLDDIQGAFRELAQKVPADGFIVCNPNHPKFFPVLNGVKAKIIDYTKEGLIPPLVLPGAHNKENAQAAISVARALGLPEEIIERSLAAFQGTWRRFDYKGTTRSGAYIYDDYAHHPAEVRATILGFREKFPGKKLTIIFQPHLYSRTRDHLQAFAESLSLADQVIVLPIYASREIDPGDIKSEDIAHLLGENGRVAEGFSRVMPVLGLLSPNDVVVTMGAGDVYKVGEEILGTDPELLT
jgi:UDP-N-acetylmuramate--alanine ligase